MLISSNNSYITLVTFNIFTSIGKSSSRNEALTQERVKVLLKYKHTDAEISVVCKRLNFAIAPVKIPAKEIVVITEVVCSKLDGEVADLLRNEVVGILHNANPPKSNLTKQEREVLKSLKQNKDIVMLPADKGKEVVVMTLRHTQNSLKSY